MARKVLSTSTEKRPPLTDGDAEVPVGTNDVCPSCGQPSKSSLATFLGRLGITDEMLNNLKSQMQNVDVDEYLNTARDYLAETGGGARSYVKENPAKVAAAVAAFAVGAALIWCSEKEHAQQDSEDRVRQLELKRALDGRRYKLEEVLSELGVAP